MFEQLTFVLASDYDFGDSDSGSGYACVCCACACGYVCADSATAEIDESALVPLPSLSLTLVQL